jgi:hypothetical protein
MYRLRSGKWEVRSRTRDTRARVGLKMNNIYWISFGGNEFGL